MLRFEYPQVFHQSIPPKAAAQIWFLEPSTQTWYLGYKYLGDRFVRVDERAARLSGSGGGGTSGSTGGSSGGSTPTFSPQPGSTAVTVPDADFVSYFPPVSYTLSCEQTILYGGQSQTDYVIELLVAFDVYDPTLVNYKEPNNYGVLITKAYTYITLEAPGPITAVGTYQNNNVAFPRIYGWAETLPPSTDPLIEPQPIRVDLYKTNNFYYSDPREEVPVIFQITGKYLFANTELIDSTITRKDGISDVINDTIAIRSGEVCTLTVEDRSGILFTKQYVGRPNINIQNPG